MNRVKFLHIGKTGGSAIRKATKKHHQIDFLSHNTKKIVTPLHDGYKCEPVNGKFCFFVRDPVTRFISGFTYVKKWIEIEKKPVSPKIRRFFRKFLTPESLALELKSPEVQKMIQKIPHIRTYLHTYINIDRDRNNIVFVGRFEHLEEDFDKLKTLTGLPPHLKLEQIGGTSEYNSIKGLSPQAIQNIKEHYASDYQVIEKLISLGLLDSTYLKPQPETQNQTETQNPNQNINQ